MEKLKAKGGKKLSPLEQKAKLGVVGAMRDQAAEMMGDKIKGLKKVTVASNDKKGLAEGLDKAKELIDSKPGEHEDIESDKYDFPGKDDAMAAAEHHDNGMENDEETPEHESLESPKEEASEHEDMSEDEIDSKLKELMALKAKKQFAK